MKELEVELRLRNNLLKQRRMELGLLQEDMALSIGVSPGAYRELECLRIQPTKPDWGSKQARMCIAPGCSWDAERPILRNRRLCSDDLRRNPSPEEWNDWKKAKPLPRVWKDVALKIAEYFCVEPDELWPESVRHIQRSRAEIKMDVGELAAALTLPMAALRGMAAKQDMDMSFLRERLGEALETLTSREQRILCMRFGLDEGGDGMSLAEIGESEGCTANRIMQIEKKAIRKLRHPSRSRRLRPFYESVEDEKQENTNGTKPSVDS